MPLETISGIARARCEAGTTAASLEMALTCANISAVFLADFTAALSAVERGEGGEKIKGRLVAAAEKTKEADIHSHNYQGTQSTNGLGRLSNSLFLRL
jgi:hypothetical protein